VANRFKLPRPLIHAKNLDFSFAGLKTAVLTQIQLAKNKDIPLDEAFKADLAKEFVEAVVDVLSSAKFNWRCNKPTATDL
jgi:N6-L-threonylcarbamoyladenine synthase